MYLLFILLLSAAANASTFTAILEAQGKALDKMEVTSSKSGYKLTELLTDIAITKKGLLGISALSSRKALEIRWRRKSAPLLSEQEDGFEVSGETSEKELDSLAGAIVDLANKSGKLRAPAQRIQVRQALEDLRLRVAQISVTQVAGWKLKALRLDLNFSTSGEVALFTKAGVAFRVRLEWDIIPRESNQALAQNDETKFVIKVLSALNAANSRINIPGFEASRIAIGVGASVRRKFFGLWRYSAGFIGYLLFVPDSNNKEHHSPALAEAGDSTLELGGFEEEGAEMSFWRRRKYVRVDFAAGMVSALATAAGYASQVRSLDFKHWYVSDFKTVSDISRTGLLGLADVTTRGVIEIDHRSLGL